MSLAGIWYGNTLPPRRSLVSPTPPRPYRKRPSLGRRHERCDEVARRTALTFGGLTTPTRPPPEPYPTSTAPGIYQTPGRPPPNPYPTSTAHPGPYQTRIRPSPDLDQSPTCKTRSRGFSNWGQSGLSWGCLGASARLSGGLAAGLLWGPSRG